MLVRTTIAADLLKDILPALSRMIEGIPSLFDVRKFNNIFFIVGWVHRVQNVESPEIYCLLTEYHYPNHRPILLGV